MANFSSKKLQTFLKSCSKDELGKQIVELCQKFDQVKEFYTVKLSGGIDDTEIREKYKIIIRNEYFPKRGFGKIRQAVVRKAINDYKKVAYSPVGVIDLQLFYVESACDFTKEFGDIDENFYVSAENTFEKTVKEIVKLELQTDFKERCQNIVNNAVEGWGFYDQLSDIYSIYFKED